jgi:hypothetical protein
MNTGLSSPLLARQADHRHPGFGLERAVLDAAHVGDDGAEAPVGPERRAGLGR